MNATPISQRESEILHLIIDEYTSKEIASKLFISVETVMTHRKNVMVKLDARNTAGLVRRAFERGLVRLTDGVHSPFVVGHAV